MLNDLFVYGEKVNLAYKYFIENPDRPPIPSVGLDSTGPIKSPKKKKNKEKDGKTSDSPEDQAVKRKERMEKKRAKPIDTDLSIGALSSMWF